jgi:group I intron endonuclease
MDKIKKKPWDWHIPRVIYVIRNLVNGKVYVGQSKNFYQRMGIHKSGRDNSYIGNAIQKYGIENFHVKIVHDCPNRDEADFWEKFYIEAYDSFHGPGYNLTEGGSNPWTPDAVKRMKEQRKQENLSDDSKKRGKYWTKYLGVSKSKDSDRFYTSVTVEPASGPINPSKLKTKFFLTAELAAEAYDKISIKVLGDSAVLNFPEKKEDYLKEDLDAFYDFFMTRDRPKNSPYKFVSKDKSKLGKALGRYKFYISGEIRKKFLKNFGENGNEGYLKLGIFDTAEEAAQFADKVMFFYNLSTDYNFPDKVKDFDRDELAAFFESITFKKISKYLGVSLNKGRWVSYFNYKNVQITVGSFDTAEQARDAREEFMKTFTEEKFQEIQAAKPIKKFKHPGITFNRFNKTWTAAFESDGKKNYIGIFPTEQEAVEARQKFIEEFEKSQLQ